MKFLSTYFPGRAAIENTPLLLVTFPTTIVLSGRESNCTVACPTGLLSSPSITDPVTVMRLPLCAQERVAQVHTSNNNNINFFIFFLEILMPNVLWTLLSTKGLTEKCIYFLNNRSTRLFCTPNSRQITLKAI